jgi:hypothetical protein
MAGIYRRCLKYQESGKTMGKEIKNIMYKEVQENKQEEAQDN